METKHRFGLGLVIGKFLPPHRGHHFVIDSALSRCDRVEVIICEKPSDPIPGKVRAEWLEENHPAAHVRVIDDRYDENDSKIWAENTLHWLGRAPDAVFTSESYGHAYAGHLGCEHVLVDQARQTVPCSGTAVRQNAFAQWDFLSAPARAWYARRIVVLGAESTGTTTLAMALADQFQTLWVPEYGREYSLLKQQQGETKWRSAEFLHIAREQTHRENVAARQANRILICDTNAFATMLWHRRYMETDCPELAQFAAHGKVDFYILTGDEIPFVQDGLRDGEAIRHDMHTWFQDALRAQSTPWLMVTGSEDERLVQASTEIAKHFGLSSVELPRGSRPERSHEQECHGDSG